MNDLEKLIYEEAKNDFDYIVALRRHFHMHPELSRKEFNTATRIDEELKKLGLSPKRVDETGVYAEIKGEKGVGKTIVLRADMDALPITEEHICDWTSVEKGVMHACGHDVHTASLIGAARLLVKNRDKFAGTIRLTFQQAEEIGYGGMQFVNGGYLDGADRTFGLHTAPNVEVGKVVAMPGPNNASVDWFKITIHGLSAHVSTPEKGIDAIYIASQIVINLQALITRRTSPMDNVLIGIGKVEAGTAYNIVADNATLEGTVRVFTVENRKFVKEQIENICNSIAKSFGGTVDFEWKDFTSPLINEEKSTKEVEKVAKSLYGDKNVIVSRKPSLSGDDFAEFINRVPGSYAFVGSGNIDKPDTMVAQHNSHFDVDEDAILVAVVLYTAYAIEYLNGMV